MGQDNAAAAAGAPRSASASASDFASLSGVLASTDAGESGNSSTSGEHSKFDTINVFNPDDNVSSKVADGQDADVQKRFQLLNSPLLPSERNVWELATDAMLQDIYGQTSEEGETGMPSVSSSTDASSSLSDTSGSAGASPFDLVDLDIEIEEPLHLQLGLGDHEATGGAAAAGFLPHDAGLAKTADAASVDWPGLLASLVA